MPYDANGEWFDELPSGYQGGGAEPMPQSQPPPQEPQQDYGPTPGYWLMGNAPESTPAPQMEGYGPTPQDWLMPQPIPQPQAMPPMPQARPPEPGDGYMKFTDQGWVGQDAPGAPQPPPQNMQQAQQGNTFRMEFMNPYTGKGGFLNVPNTDGGRQIYDDYVRRGYQVRFPKQEEQQQQAMQQDGPNMPPISPQEMLAQVQLQPHEQKEFQRLQGLMTTVAKQMAEGQTMGGGTRAMLALKRAIEPYEKRQQMAKQLAMKAAADDAKKKVVLDAEANKAFFEANQPVVRQLPDGSTAVYQLMPDGKYDIQKTKTPNELQQEKFKFQQEQAEARRKAQEDAEAAKVVPFDSVKQRNEAEADAMNEFDKDSRDIYKKGKNAQGEEILTKEYTPEYRKRVAEIFEARKAQHEAGQRANQDRMNPGQQGQPGQQQLPASGVDAKKELDAIVAQHKNIANIQDPSVRARAESLYRIYREQEDAVKANQNERMQSLRDDKDQQRKQWAKKELERIGPPALIESADTRNYRKELQGIVGGGQ